MRTRTPLAAAAVVLLLVAAVPEPAPERPVDPVDVCAEYISAEYISAGVSCSGSVIAFGGSAPLPPEPTGPAAVTAQPVDLATDGRPCAAGSTRPSVGTVEAVTLSANFVTASGSLPDGATFEYQTVGDPDSVYGQVSIERPKPRAVMEFAPGELGPGDSYRWRVRGGEAGAGPGWSDWCEFVVAADAPDLRELDPTELDALVELGLRPERRYPVELSESDWRRVREPFDLESDGPADPDSLGEFEREEKLRLDRVAAAVRPDRSGRLTLTGAQWATVEVQLAGWTVVVQAGNDEVEPEFQTALRPYWRVVDRISAQLGGPRHPKLGIR